MARGEHIRVRRSWYWHHGIDLGDGTVVHLPSEPGDAGIEQVTRTSMGEFARGGMIEVVREEGALPPEEVVERALGRLGRHGYHLIWNNCEHFARWCVTGAHRSGQVERMARHGIMVGLATQAGVGWLARRSGARLLVRTVPVLRPLATGVMAAGAVLSLLNRARMDGFPASPVRPSPPGHSTPYSRTPPG